jgi:hypothetical protein
MVASAVEGSCQVPVVGGGKPSDLHPVERGYLTGWTREGTLTISLHP